MKIFSFLVVSLSFASSLSLPARNPGEQFHQNVNTQNAGLFSGPQVFLTLSAVAGVFEDKYLDTLFELNWANFENIQDGDRVGIFDYSPTDEPSKDHAALSLELVSANSGSYFKTDIRFGRPPMTSDSEGDNCLGFWIAYINSENSVLKSNCFRKYPRWMNELKETIGDVPLHSLMIPGTHDAGAIREYDGIGSENVPVRYSVTQEEQLYRQFLHGIRYVDIRVAHYPNTPEKFWINHGTARFAPLLTLFDAVKRFVEETKEIIFMDFHGFPVGMDEMVRHDELLVFVQEQIGNHLVHKSMIEPDYTNVTSNQLWELDRTVILTYQRDDVSSRHDFLWPYLIHAWGNVNQVNPLEEYFANVALPNYGCQGKFWSAMAEMTPTVQDAIIFPFRGLRGFAQLVNGNAQNGTQEV